MGKLISLQEREEWTAYVNGAAEYDFYHTWLYHSLDLSGDPFLFVYEEDHNYIAFPLLKRAISQTSFSDLGSVYGYTGPISNRKFEDMEDSFREKFMISFLAFLKKEQNISVFSRLHPLFNQYLLFEKFGGIHENGKTVAIDLSLSIEEQRKKYRRNTLKSVKKAWHAGYSVRESKTQEDIDLFYEIYTHNMERVEATDYYFFSKAYFMNLVGNEDFDCRLLLVCFKDEVVCGMITTFTNGIIQGHLVGTKHAYLVNSPAKFLVDEITLIGRKEGMKYLHLGGGVGFKMDTLFNWKAGFSDLFLEYKSWRYVANNMVYHALVNKRKIDQHKKDIDFFPLYRAIVNGLTLGYFQMVI
ncbi:GNAT family N-acetyltransferase [Pedobacter gandavensis]|uniref:GNAT family N-acetyltransferase n=1 Tax=Pedobacter gandavensis TaxID=2679963 RepID=A0ABR6ET70_9SPHI|nr:GNAT family N-acetyltransferase [Pedobacter gandavensis]MBB2148460.1 GNAT family N-acetyltransferase [Pedobacter gandavensis]